MQLIEGDYEVYEKEGKFSIEKLPSRKVIAQGLNSLEEVKRRVPALQPDEGKRGKVIFEELANAGLVKDGQTLCFYHTKLFTDEQGQVIVSSNKLKYKADGKIYSVSELAKKLLIKHGFKHDEHGVQGPIYWKTEDGKLLHDLNEQIRIQRGDRK